MIDLKSGKVKRLVREVKKRCRAEGLHKMQLELEHLRSKKVENSLLLAQSEIIQCYELGIEEYIEKEKERAAK